MHAELVVRTGADPVRRYALRLGQAFVLGRADSVAIQIDDSLASRRHASLELRPDGLFVSDLGSRNGTFLEGQRLEPNSPAAVRDGDRIEVGKTVVQVRLVDAARSPASPTDGTQRMDLPPVPVDEYEVLGEIGEGATGRVYAAWQKLMRRNVAIKVLDPELDSDPTERERFLRQGWICTRIDSPYVVSVYDVRISHGRVLLVMELVQGPSVRDRLADGPIPLPEALKIAEDVAKALDAAARVGIVHRDVKPSNILLVPGGVAKLVDFGIAKAVDVADATPSKAHRVSAQNPLSTDVTPLGEGLGTLAYMAPEQAVEARSVDTRSDVYSLGATLYHMIAGHSPHALLSTNPNDLLAMLRAGVPLPLLSSTAPGCPDDVCELVHATLARSPDARPQTAPEVVRRLRVLRLKHSPALDQDRGIRSTHG